MRNATLEATLRRHWPLIGAVGVFLVFMVSHQIWFKSTARGYQAALKRADELGVAMDPEDTPAALPPRLFTLLADNSLPAAEAQGRGDSGALTAELLEGLTGLTSRLRIAVIVTEPGPVTQQNESVVVRAHLRLRCRYDQFVELLDAITRGPKLYSVDRFTISSEASGAQILELWISRLILKQTRAGR